MFVLVNFMFTLDQSILRRESKMVSLRFGLQIQGSLKASKTGLMWKRSEGGKTVEVPAGGECPCLQLDASPQCCCDHVFLHSTSSISNETTLLILSWT